MSISGKYSKYILNASDGLINGERVGGDEGHTFSVFKIIRANGKKDGEMKGILSVY